MMKLPEALKKVREVCYNAARAYKPKPYDGQVVLFRASENRLSSVNQESAWKRLAPAIEIYEVSGHHGNIVDQPQVAMLAEEVRTCLEIAFRRQDEGHGIQPAPFVVMGDSEDQLEIA